MGKKGYVPVLVYAHQIVSKNMFLINPHIDIVYMLQQHHRKPENSLVLQEI